MKELRGCQAEGRGTGERRGMMRKIIWARRGDKGAEGAKRVCGMKGWSRGQMAGGGCAAQCRLVLAQIQVERAARKKAASKAMKEKKRLKVCRSVRLVLMIFNLSVLRVVSQQKLISEGQEKKGKNQKVERRMHLKT